MQIVFIFRAQDSTLYDELKQTYTDHIPLHLAQLKVLDESEVRLYCKIKQQQQNKTKNQQKQQQQQNNNKRTTKH